MLPIKNYFLTTWKPGSLQVTLVGQEIVEALTIGDKPLLVEHPDFPLAPDRI
jgi:hypothetical protein